MLNRSRIQRSVSMLLIVAFTLMALVLSASATSSFTPTSPPTVSHGTPDSQAGEGSTDGDVGAQWIDTVFDIGSLAMSVAEFQASPTLSNGFWVLADSVSVVFPGIPAVSGAKRMILGSEVLQKALKVGNASGGPQGIMRYRTMVNMPVPTGWPRHHIFEKRFRISLGVDNIDDMLSIAVPSSDPLYSNYHQMITNKIREKIPNKPWYMTESMYYSQFTPDQVVRAHVNSYWELYLQTGDTYFEFLSKFAESAQWLAK